MNIRAQISMVFHLDKCIGCHTCSISCKNIWTDRKGTEYMWWNNVETKPGTGYPTLWEDQEKYRGGWETDNGKLRLKLQGKIGTFLNIFYNPYLPTIDDYYEPWTYRYEDLFNSPDSDDQPTARPISMITGKPIEIDAGPNWDDDLGGSPIYAENDINLSNLSDSERYQLFQLERLVFFYLPRICNHCLNPGCVAACPSRAIYKRGEDGIVLVNQEKCRGWRMCISACPYKKVYYNWTTGKAEKCILCFPRMETGQAPACFHSCVGRIRYTGLILYDADMIEKVASAEPSRIVSAIRDIIKDPFDRSVIESARANGIPDQLIECAQRSPVYRFLKVYRLALPLHPEFRTIPMLFYVPPLLPVLSFLNRNSLELKDDIFPTTESLRIPIKYLSALFSAGNEREITDIYKKLIAIRLYKRASSVGDISHDEAQRFIDEAGLSPDLVEEIYRLTSMPSFSDRFVIPSFMREVAIEAVEQTGQRKTDAGFGFIKRARRRW
uniref:Nitrate reductase 1, beta subunit n=1 Tax=uncultured prokaryote TaxID=198431 RepID=H5SEM6_9ZZZZ|nr:nitrate reductase 1, beta subunit [uncultured prokaryote]